MLDVKVEFSESYFRKLGLRGNSYRKVIDDTLNMCSVQAERYIKQEAPVKTGNLRQSIHHFRDGGTFGVSAVGAPYWSNVEYGTAPHTITPRNAEALSFQVGNKQVYAKKVQHPGTRPNPFVKRGANKLRRSGDTRRAFDRALNLNGMS